MFSRSFCLTITGIVLYFVSCATIAMSPIDLVQVLNDLFTRFDEIVDKYGLNKVKTIGGKIFLRRLSFFLGVYPSTNSEVNQFRLRLLHGYIDPNFTPQPRERRHSHVPLVIRNAGGSK